MTIPPHGSPLERLRSFFEFMWQDTEGYVYLPTKDRQTGEWKKRAYKWPEHKESVVTYVLDASASNKDVYFAPALFSRPKPIRENVIGTHVIWADYDGAAPDDWEPLTATGREDGTQPLPGAPTLRVQSSLEGNQHVYWKLKELNTDVEFIQQANRQIAYLTGADTSGWDINQVLRPIETRNYKYDESLPVFVFEESRREYLASDFSHFKPVKQLIDDSIVDGELPSIETILAEHTWPGDDIELINKSLEELNGRDRSSALSRVAFSCAENGLTDSEIYVVLVYCDDKWGKYRDRGDRKRRLIELVNRARQKHPYGSSDLTFAGLREDAPVATELNVRTVYGLRDLLEENIQIEWMWEGAIEKYGLGIIVSEPGIGKTQIMLRLAMAGAIWKPFLHWKPVRRHKTMFISCEMNLPSIKQVLTTMSESCTPEEIELLQRNFYIVPHGQPLDLTSKPGRKFFEAIIEEYKPDGIYIDSLQTIYPKKLSDDEIREVFNYLSEVRQKYGVYVFLIHHNRKAQEANKRPRHLSDVYGNYVITALPDYVLNLWRKGANAPVIEVTELKNRLAQERPMQRITRGPSLTFLPYEGGDDDDDGLSDGNASDFGGLMSSLE